MMALRTSHQGQAVSSRYEAWRSHEHPEEFDNLRFVPTFALKGAYQRFNEVRLLREMARDMAGGFSLLEVGCATGEFYRYLSAQYPKAAYTGYDISRPAIERARNKFPTRESFHIVDEELNGVQMTKADIVFSRDVVHHQTRPFDFLKRLYGLCTRSMILRMRTRDVGESVTDAELSCQYVYGKWVPFLVLNCEEVVSELTRMEPRPARIKLVKDYMVLGGLSGRLLPKGCYEESAGTAVTAILVEKGGDGHSGLKIEQEVREEPAYSSLLGRITRKSLERLLKQGYAGRTWW